MTGGDRLDQKRVTTEREIMTHDKLIGCLKTSSEGTALDEGVLEHVAEPAEEVVETGAALVDVDEQVRGLGEEDVVDVRDNEHRRVRRAGLKCGRGKARV